MDASFQRGTLYKLWGILILFLLICFLFLFVCTDVFPLLFCGRAQEYRCVCSLTAFCEPQKKTVVLDAGHGGYDSGAGSASGLLEKDLNLAVTKKIAAFLRLYDIRVCETRPEDSAPQLLSGSTRKHDEILSRVKLCEEAKPDLVLSVHMNSFPQSVCSGSQVFYSARDPQSEVFAVTLQSTLVDMIQPDNRRSAKETGDILLLSRLKTPAALLECGFLSNESEAALLSDERYQSKLAFSCACAIISYLSDH